MNMTLRLGEVIALKDMFQYTTMSWTYGDRHKFPTDDSGCSTRMWTPRMNA